MPQKASPSQRPSGGLGSVLKRGWKVTRQEAKTLPRIVEWSWVAGNQKPQVVPVHFLAGKDNWLSVAWTLASWFQCTESAWPVVLHDDGTLPEEAGAAFKKMFGEVRVISRAEADAALTTALRAFPFCAEYRMQNPLALRVFDVPHFAQHQQFLLFGDHLLFFNYPREILDWVQREADDVWFNEDAQENAPITAGEARSELGVKIWPRVQSGLCLLTKAMTDFDLCDQALAQTSLLSSKGNRVEQTLLMLSAARYGKGGLLPRTYEVSTGKLAAEDAVARNYAGPAADRFFAEGLPRLAPLLFSPEEA